MRSGAPFEVLSNISTSERRPSGWQPN
jgi:hypothetical protein